MYYDVRIRNKMTFDKKYLCFIIPAIIFSSIASVTTLFMLSIGKCREYNPYALVAFNTIGMIPTMICGIIGLVAIMVVIPYILKQNQKIGITSSCILFSFVVFVFLDALNDVSLLFHIQPTYTVSHAILTSIVR